MKSEKIIIGIKAFHKDMTCNGMQYKEGETYTHDGKVKCCESGFHFCENPLDVLNYYDLCDSTFHEVESLPNSEIDKNEDDSKIATSKIRIGVNLDLSEFVKASIEFIFNSCKINKESDNRSQSAQSGDGSKSAQSGYWSQSAQSGDGSKSAQSGYWSQSAQSGDKSQSAQSGNWSKSAQSGDKSKSAQSGDGSKSAQSGDRSKSAQSGDGSKSAQSGDWSKSAQSGDRSKSAQSGDWSQSAQSGDRSQSAQSGNGSQSAQSGDRSKSAQSGDGSQIELNAKNCIGASIGNNCKIKGKIGCWIVLAEYDKENNPLLVKTTKIDGVKIKEDVFYILKNGEFFEIESEE